MALKKVKHLNTGIDAEYWKITKITCDRVTRKCEYVISLFKDRDCSISGKVAVLNKTICIVLSKEEMETNLILTGYNKIKEYANDLKTINISGNTVEPYSLEPDLQDAESV